MSPLPVGVLDFFSLVDVGSSLDLFATLFVSLAGFVEIIVGLGATRKQFQLLLVCTVTLILL